MSGLSYIGRGVGQVRGLEMGEVRDERHGEGGLGRAAGVRDGAGGRGLAGPLAG